MTAAGSFWLRFGDGAASFIIVGNITKTAEKRLTNIEMGCVLSVLPPLT
jgi:hypothetical protein